MLSHFGLLDSTKGIVKVIRFVGAITIIAAGAMAVYFSLQPAEQEFEKEL